MTRTIEFIFDFGSPNAYFANRVLPEIAERTGARLVYTPCLLGGIFKATGNQPPMVAFGGVKGKMEYEQREIERFLTKHSIHEFQFNPHFPVNTLMLMRGAIVAERNGDLDRYIAAGLYHMWEDPKKMDDPDTFVAAMTASGFDGADLLHETQDPEIKQKLVQNTEAAVERGVFGIPTFFVGEEMFFGKDRLLQVEEELMSH